MPIEDTYDELMLRFEHPDTIAYLSLSSAFILFLIATVAFGAPESKLTKFAYGGLGGTIGGQYYFLKGAMMLVGIGGDVYNSAGTYFVILAAIASAGGGVLVLNSGLKRYNALYIAPMYQSFLVVFGALSGAIFFRELETLSAFQLILFSVSLAVMLGGIFCCMLSSQPQQASKRLLAEAEDETSYGLDTTQKLVVASQG